MRRPLQAPGAISARRASRKPTRGRRAALAGCSKGVCVRLGPGGLRLPHPGSLTGLGGGGVSRSVLTARAGFLPPHLPLVETRFALGVTLGHAPLQGAVRGARPDLAPGLPRQAFRLDCPCPARSWGLGLCCVLRPPVAGCQVSSEDAAKGQCGPNMAVSLMGPSPDTAVCGGRDQSLIPSRGRVVLEVDPAARGARCGPSGLRQGPADTVSTPRGLRSGASPLDQRAA
jgi:hypothetical protein